MLATIGLSYWVISSELESQRHGYKYQSFDSLSAPHYNPQGAGIWVKIFIAALRATHDLPGHHDAEQRQQEEQHAARTRQSINLAEYPASFEMARRLPRRP